MPTMTTNEKISYIPQSVPYPGPPNYMTGGGFLSFPGLLPNTIQP